MNAKIKYSLFFFFIFSNIIYCQIDEKTIIIKSPSDEELMEKRIDGETLKKMEFLSKLDTVYVAFKKSDRQKTIKEDWALKSLVMKRNMFSIIMKQILFHLLKENTNK